MLPLSEWAVVLGGDAGWVLAFARGVGESGATIVFAGNVQGQTQTLPLAVLPRYPTAMSGRLLLRWTRGSESVWRRRRSA